MKPKSYYAIFFDVLGQKDFLAKLKRNNDWNRGAAQFDALLNPLIMQLLETLCHVREWADKRQISKSRHPADRLTKLSDRALKNAARRLDAGVMHFSDSILLCVDANNPWAGSVLFHWLAYLANNMMKFRASGLFLRGAISIGQAYPVKLGQYVGPLIDDLERMEKDAFSSRIVVSPSFIDATLQHNGCLLRGEDCDTGIVDVSYGLLSGDIDGTVVVDDISYMLEHGVPDGYESLWSAAIRRCEKLLSRAVGHKAWQLSHLREWLCEVGGGHGLRYGRGRFVVSNKVQPVIESDLVGNYMVLYLRYRPNPVNGKRGYVEMVRRLSIVVNNFRQHQFKWLEATQNIGVEQVSNYLMVYVRDDGEVSRKQFVTMVWHYLFSVICDMPHGVYIYGALSYGVGWEGHPNSLLGPVVGEAHRLTVDVTEYPRIVVNELALKLIREGSLPLYVYEDVDRRFALSYLHPKIAMAMKKLTGIDFDDQVVSNLKEIYRSIMKLSQVSAVKLSDVPLANQLRMLLGYYQNSANYINIDAEAILSKVRSPRFKHLKPKM